MVLPAAAIKLQIEKSIIIAMISDQRNIKGKTKIDNPTQTFPAFQPASDSSSPAALSP